MPTNAETRLEALEKRMDKLDTYIDTLQKLVAEMQATNKINGRWVNGILSVVCCIGGGLIGHFVK